MSRSTKSTPARRLRRHGDAPANWQWRDGRPRWTPSPTLRRAGWRGLDLKDATGRWLSDGASRDRAHALNATVADWRAGLPIDPAFVAIAPADARLDDRDDAGAPVPSDPLCIGPLLDSWYASDVFGRLKPRTRDGYRKAIKRGLDALAGYAEQAPRDDARATAAQARAVAQVKALHIQTLAPFEARGGIKDPLRDAYWALHAHAGVNQAYATLAAFGSFLSWAREWRSRTIHNWASEVSRETPQGRIVTWTFDEIRHMVRTADAMGLPEIGDAIVLGLDLSWSQTDRLNLPWDRLRNDMALTGQQGRQKTGRRGGTPLTALGRARVADIRRRHADMDAHPTHVIWSATLKGPMNHDDGSFYRKRFAFVRAEAARTMPSVAAKTDADLRDTAFTWMDEAGMDDTLKASRTLQSRANMKNLADAHYGDINPALAEQGRAAYDAYLTRKGYAL
ncbi:hypothetical protein [Brevundimonas sp. A19_0]|uniref:hypothetical protein n=1 Tax=Brevundimonas sp. A19_0 TaxID=2821087 RepID=UPI001AD9E4CD|nr:hypothetical protein [Brevundimonas sp. A19_0]MBO9502055.1 hypothetical protein [Brevundimonas sp. A19_0]